MKDWWKALILTVWEGVKAVKGLAKSIKAARVARKAKKKEKEFIKDLDSGNVDDLGDTLSDGKCVHDSEADKR